VSSREFTVLAGRGAWGWSARAAGSIRPAAGLRKAGARLGGDHALPAARPAHPASCCARAARDLTCPSRSAQVDAGEQLAGRRGPGDVARPGAAADQQARGHLPPAPRCRRSAGRSAAAARRPSRHTAGAGAAHRSTAFPRRRRCPGQVTSMPSQSGTPWTWSLQLVRRPVPAVAGLQHRPRARARPPDLPGHPRRAAGDPRRTELPAVPGHAHQDRPAPVQVHAHDLRAVIRFHKGPPIVVDGVDTPSMNARDSYGERGGPAPSWHQVEQVAQVAQERRGPDAPYT
jgi:hypothetical protein